MFVAKFQQVKSDKFNADKNGNMPYIGEVLAGTSKGAILNGTMFERDGLEPQSLYACENFIDADYPENVQTRIISKVSVVEFMSLRTALGAPKNAYGTAAEANATLDVIEETHEVDDRLS